VVQDGEIVWLTGE